MVCYTASTTFLSSSLRDFFTTLAIHMASILKPFYQPSHAQPSKISADLSNPEFLNNFNDSYTHLQLHHENHAVHKEHSSMRKKNNHNN